MANLHAIATITAALRARLSDVLPTAVAGAIGTAVRPGETGGSGGLPAIGVNVFLYATRANAAFRNADLPSRNAAGKVLTRPTAANDLDYLFTFYAPDLVTAHRLLGCTLRSFHARPTITPAMIQAVEQGAGGIVSGLADQPDPVRITPLDLSIEEMSKLWSVLFQVRYVLSTAFRLGPVLIEAALDTLPQPPARTYAVAALALRSPVITGVQAASGPDDPIVPGTRIAVLGRFDPAQAIAVSIDGTDLGPLLATHRDRLELALPADIAVGAAGLAVRYDVPLGQPSVPHRGVGSGLFALLILPQIATAGGNPDITVDQVTGSGAQLRSARFRVGLTAPVAVTRQATLLLIDPASEETRLWLGEARAQPADPLTFQVTGLPAGRYVVQVGVDGALSPVQRDANPASPTYGQPVAPAAQVS